MKTLLKNLFAKKSLKTTTKTWRPSLEGLEERSLLAAHTLPGPIIIPVSTTASLSNGVLKIVGTNLDDNISVKQVNGLISVLGVAGAFPVSAVSRIDVFGLNGNDFIHLDSETQGGLPIMKPTIIRGGNGNDLILGGAAADQLFGDAGDDTLYGRNGNDYLNGGLGMDKAYGGIGNDLIVGDLADLHLAGQAGVDTIRFEKVDPAPLAGANPAAFKTAIQDALDDMPAFSKTKNGFKYTVSDLEVESVTVSNGVTTLALKAKVRLQQFVLGQQVFSTTGSLKFTVQPQLNATLVDGLVTNASIGMANVQVTSMNLNNVPNWIDNAAEVREFLEAKIAAQPPSDYTNDLQAYVAFGGSLGPIILA